MGSGPSSRPILLLFAMLPLLSYDSGMTAWVKHKYKGSSVSGEEEEDLVMLKLQVIQKIS